MGTSWGLLGDAMSLFFESFLGNHGPLLGGFLGNHWATIWDFSTNNWPAPVDPWLPAGAPSAPGAPAPPAHSPGLNNEMDNLCVVMHDKRYLLRKRVLHARAFEDK